jgi:hypothetical protein
MGLVGKVKNPASLLFRLRSYSFDPSASHPMACCAPDELSLVTGGRLMIGLHPLQRMLFSAVLLFALYVSRSGSVAIRVRLKKLMVLILGRHRSACLN